jgi:hypothetical protein
MKMIQNPTVPDHSGSSPASAQAPRRAGLLSRFFAALHESRRLQAAQTIRHYRHLVADDTAAMAMRLEPQARRTTSPETARSSHAGRSHTLPLSLRWLAVRLLITLVIVGFGALHVIGGTLLDHKRAPQRTEPPPVAGQGD